MAFCTSMTEASRSVESGVAWIVAIRLSPVLSMVARGQGLVTLGTLEAGSVPVLPHRGLLLRKIHLLITSRALRHFSNAVVGSLKIGSGQYCKID